MVVEAVQNYVNLVNGVKKVTRDRAQAAAKALLAQAGLEEVANEAGERVSKLVEEITLANRANRELVENLIAAEIDKAAGRWGFVRTDDVEALREEIAELRKALIRATTSTGAANGARTARKTTARRAASRTSAAQGPPLGGAPDLGGVDPSHPELVPSEPLPHEPGPIQPNVTPTAAKKRTAAKKPARKKPTTAPATPPTPVADGDVAE